MVINARRMRLGVIIFIAATNAGGVSAEEAAASRASAWRGRRRMAYRGSIENRQRRHGVSGGGIAWRREHQNSAQARRAARQRHSARRGMSGGVGALWQALGISASASGVMASGSRA